MGNLRQIEALVFALKGSSPEAEIVFLDQNLAIRPASIVRGFQRTSWVRSRIVSSTS
jgi:hypothetical protein